MKFKAIDVVLLTEDVENETIEKVSDYLQELANHVTEEDSADLPKFLRVLAERMRNRELL